MRYKFSYKWRDEHKNVMVYVAEGDWTWKDYHAAVHASIYFMHQISHPMDSLVDLRGGTRSRLPAGALGHIRTFGKKNNPNQTGRALLIGVPPEDEHALLVGPDRRLPTSDGFVQFVDTDDDIARTLAEWQTAP